MNRIFPAVCLLLVILTSPPRAEEPGASVRLHEDFSKGADRWQPTDSKAWKVIDLPDGKGKAYSQFVKQSAYKPPHRSPYNIALLRDVSVTDFTLVAEAQSTIKDYGHRDMCLFFGYQDPAHFYYVHLGKKADDHANQIFIVNGADRKKISTTSTEGTNWTDGWHTLKVVRTVADGKVEVFFDDLKKPVMTATDKTFLWGQVGIGSFDDTGNWRSVKLEGKRK